MDASTAGRSSSPSTLLHRPRWILAGILALVFAAEVAVMLALPHLMPNAIGGVGGALLDAVLLTVVCAPALWWVVIGPLRRIALQAHERSETIVANAGDGILTVNRQGVVVSCNQAGSALLAETAGDLIGASIASFIPNWPSTVSQLPAQMELEAVRSDGRTFPLHVSMSEYLKEAEGKLIVIIRDLTASKQAEQQRLLLVRHAEALRAQQMTTLAQLATGVAHEIRNPLTAIKMLIQVNRSSFAEAGLPTDDLELVEQEIRRMERSINSLLDYARPEKGEPKHLVLQDSIRRVLQLIQGQCEARQVRVVLDLPEEDVRISGDEAHIQQLLLNLCLNAMDAMGTGGKIDLRLRQSLDEAELTVTDTGPGICEEIMDHIYDPFVTTKVNGIGLGLGICRRIAEAHQGRLEGFNSAGGGAVFRLTLPLLDPQADEGNFSIGNEATCKSC